MARFTGEVSAVEALDLIKDLFDNASRSELADVPWLRETRETALQQVLARGLPNMRDEAWKYTDLRALWAQPFSLPSASDAAASAVLQGIGTLEDSYRLVFIGGHFCASLSRLDAFDGVEVKWGSAAVDAASHLLRNDSARVNDGILGWVARALFTQCVWISVSPGTVLRKPIEVIHLTAEGEQLTTQLQHIVVLAEGAQAALVETYASLGESKAWVNATTAIKIDSGAQLDYCFNQQVNTNSFVTTQLNVELSRDARWTAHEVALGARISRRDIISSVLGAGAEAIWGGLALLSGRQHADYQLLWDHQVPHTTSDTQYRTVLADRARGVFNGHIKVQRDAQKTQAFLQNKNMLLSADAEIDTKPQLEIWADDVKCSHGATVGRMDETALHYLRSRGLDYETARSLLIYAFASEILSPIKHEAMRRHLQGAVLAKLPGALSQQGVLA